MIPVIVEENIKKVEFHMKLEFKWEDIPDSSVSTTLRAKVIGGWIVRTGYFDPDRDIMTTESTVFISDPDHKWEI